MGNMSMATPMALREISNKAQRELASLYDDVINDTAAAEDQPPKRILFTDN